MCEAAQLTDGGVGVREVDLQGLGPEWSGEDREYEIDYNAARLGAG